MTKRVLTLIARLPVKIDYTGDCLLYTDSKGKEHCLNKGNGRFCRNCLLNGN